MPQRQAQQIIVRALVVGSVLCTVVGAVLGLAVEPILGLIAVVGITDFGLAWAFSTGKLRAPGAAVSDELAPGDASEDPSYNPYPRED